MTVSEQLSICKYNCPYCGVEIDLSIFLDKKSGRQVGGLRPICHLHGEPLHALILYIDVSGKIRSHSIIDQVVIPRDSETLQKVLAVWAHHS